VDELADSAPLVSDPTGLRRRLADHGYLFFRGLLPAAEVRAAGLAVMARLRDGGWMDDRGIPSVEPRAVNSMDGLRDPAFLAAIDVSKQYSGQSWQSRSWLSGSTALSSDQFRGDRDRRSARHRRERTPAGQ